MILNEVIYKLKSNNFYLQGHQKIFNVIENLYKEELPIDEEFIKKKLTSQNEIETIFIEVLSASPTPNVMKYIDEIIEESKKRDISKISLNIHKYIELDHSSDDILQSIGKTIDKIDSNSIDNTMQSTEIIDIVKEKMRLAFENDGKLIGQTTGLRELDKIVGAFEDGDLIVIAARPSMGKTSLISSLVTQILTDKCGVLIESLEMPAWKIMQRLISQKSNEKLSDIKRGLLVNKNKFEEASKFFACENLLISDETYPTIRQLESRIKRNIRKNKKIKNIIIDHTGKIALEGKTREDIEIGQITNMLKKIARDFNIRVFLLQQLNRSVETRDNKRPLLSDLKNSGNIEEDADIVLGLYRESYYKTKETAEQEDDVVSAEIIVLKNRDGQTGTAKVSFEGKYARFSNSKILDFKPTIIAYKD